MERWQFFLGLFCLCFGLMVEGAHLWKDYHTIIPATVTKWKLVVEEEKRIGRIQKIIVEDNGSHTFDGFEDFELPPRKYRAWEEEERFDVLNYLDFIENKTILVNGYRNIELENTTVKLHIEGDFR